MAHALYQLSHKTLQPFHSAKKGAPSAGARACAHLKIRQNASYGGGNFWSNPPDCPFKNSENIKRRRLSKIIPWKLNQEKKGKGINNFLRPKRGTAMLFPKKLASFTGTLILFCWLEKGDSIRT
jgi:hypothetical protein